YDSLRRLQVHLSVFPYTTLFRSQRQQEDHGDTREDPQPPLDGGQEVVELIEEVHTPDRNGHHSRRAYLGDRMRPRRGLRECHLIVRHSSHLVAGLTSWKVRWRCSRLRNTAECRYTTRSSRWRRGTDPWAPRRAPRSQLCCDTP